MFSQNLKILSGIVVTCYTIFSVLVGNWRKDRGLSVNIRASFEGSRARIGDRGSGKRSQRSRLGPRPKSAYCTAEGSSATESLSEDVTDGRL